MEIAIISGKGGTGKSSLSAAYATLSEAVAIADCDVDAANLYILFHPSHEEEEFFVTGQKAIIDEDACSSCGVCADYCRFDAIATHYNGQIVISETACDGCGLCAKICPFGAIDMVDEDQSKVYTGSFRNGKMVYGRLFPGEENSGKLVNRVRNKAKELARHYRLKYIILDGPPGIGCPAISTIAGVDHVIILTEPSVSGIHDLKRALEITSNFNVNTSVIINKYDLNGQLTCDIENYCWERHVSIVGKIPFDRLMVDAMVNCMSVVEWAPESEISQIIRKSFRIITG